MGCWLAPPWGPNLFLRVWHIEISGQREHLLRSFGYPCSRAYGRIVAYRKFKSFLGCSCLHGETPHGSHEASDSLRASVSFLAERTGTASDRDHGRVLRTISTSRFFVLPGLPTNGKVPSTLPIRASTSSAGFTGSSAPWHLVHPSVHIQATRLSYLKVSDRRRNTPTSAQTRSESCVPVCGYRVGYV